MDRDILDGTVVDIKDEEQFNTYKPGARRFYGAYYGPGKYMVLKYTEPCPRSCCYDYVVEVVSANHAQVEIREMQDGLELLYDNLDSQ